MHFAYLTHSLASCWNHGNAHFQRGILRALQELGHTAVAWEPHSSWSRLELIADQGEGALTAFRCTYPDLKMRTYWSEVQMTDIVDGADVVIVHEWTDPHIVMAIGALRRSGKFILLFHDTHHRAVSEPGSISRYDLSEYDGVLAFGSTLADVYRGWGWGDRVFVWHEGADITVFHPKIFDARRKGVVWVGNWGDGEREEELERFLLKPSEAASLLLDIYGVRYPGHALARLQHYGARYHGWVANVSVPGVFACHAMTVHVPRRFYTQALPGIPTIRVFEALACGIPLISAPWSDSESLFSPGEDYLVAANGGEMRDHMLALHSDPDFAASLARRGRETVVARHSCSIRATELLKIVNILRGWAGETP